MTVVNRDGTGTRTSTAFKGTRTFRISRAELNRLERSLARLDLEDLQRRFPSRKGDSSWTTLSYHGTAVVLGSSFAEVNYGEGDEQADRFYDVAELLERLGWRAFPPSFKRAERIAERETRREIRRLDRLSR